MRPPRAALALVGLLALSGCMDSLGDASAPSDPGPFLLVAYGDSFTRAADPLLGDQPQDSWATGTSPEVQSVLSRILGIRSGAEGVNAALSGAQMNDLVRQVGEHPAGADEVLILLGINDLCLAPALPLPDFQAAAARGFDAVRAAHPGAHVVVYAIPDLERFWRVAATVPAAVEFWSGVDYCRGLNPGTVNLFEAEEARERLHAFNEALRQEADRHGFLFSRGTDWPGFHVDDISPVDFFHPTRSGEARLAEGAWPAARPPGLA